MPRRGRGIDFEHRFNTSRWAEDRLLTALNKQRGLLVVRIGLSGTDPNNLIGGASQPIKIPDLLILRRSNLSPRQRQLLLATKLELQPPSAFARGGPFSFVVQHAISAIEVEFSPYRAAEMRERNWQPQSVSELTRRPRKTASPPVAPNIWVQETDLGRLLAWQRKRQVPIMVAHVFDQEAFAIPLRTLAAFAKRYARARGRKRIVLQRSKGIFRTIAVYDRLDAQGAREQKPVFRVAPPAAVKLGDVRGVVVKTQLGLSPSKKYVAHTIFTRGRIVLSQRFLQLLRQGT